MLHHVELYVSDLERSVAFWTPFMSMLGYEPRRWSGGMNYVRGVEEPYFCLLQADPEHVAAGYHRKRTGPNYYALFCEDPDRFKLEVVASEAQTSV